MDLILMIVLISRRAVLAESLLDWDVTRLGIRGKPSEVVHVVIFLMISILILDVRRENLLTKLDILSQVKIITRKALLNFHSTCTL